MQRSLTIHLQEAGLEVQGDGKILLPEWVKRIKIDVGLSDSAPNSIKWIREDPSLVVFGFEPNPKSCEVLRQRLSSQIDSNALKRQLLILPVALGREGGIANLHITSADAASSSLLRPRKMEWTEYIPVEVFPIRDLLTAIPYDVIGRIDYLKLDCQGMDLEILRGAGDELKRIALITAEPEDDQYFSSSNSLRDLVSFMKSKGFIHINARSSLRVLVGEVLAKIRFFRIFKIRFPVRISREVSSKNLSILVEDPTFVNLTFQKEVMAGEITGFQRG